MSLAAFALVIGSLSTLPTAFAALGGDAASIDADRARVRAELGPLTQRDSYSIQQLELPTGIVVREYLSASGKVFAVSWQGRTAPDLRALLGNYFEPFVAAAAASHHNHHHLAIVQPDLVVQSGGHMRALAGRAYVPSLLPPGFNTDDIR